MKNKLLFLLAIALCYLLPKQLQAQSSYVPNEFLIRYNKTGNQKTALQQSLKANIKKALKTKDIELWSAQFPLLLDGKSIANPKELAKHFENDPDITLEPNYRYAIDEVPNDPAFYVQWGLNNTGQFGGVADVDINAVEAWDNCSSASNIRLAVLDTGIDWKHPDLIENIWQNLAEDADGDGSVLEWDGTQWTFDPDDVNGVDEDGNGYIDDFIGWDFLNNDNDPYDDHSHGTHVAGIAGAKGNNGIGIAGVAWDVQLVPLKFMNNTGNGMSADAITAIAYARMMGFEILNNSWGGGNYSALLDDAVEATAANGQLFLAAAGNATNNNDSIAFYPASFSHDNIISVAATGLNDELTDFSNYGSNSVDLAAPGVAIYSTIPDEYYGQKEGTSQATPLVAGTAALLWASNPAASHLDIKSRILATVDPIAALDGLVQTGGRLNLLNAVAGFAAPAISYTATGLGVTFEAVGAVAGTTYSWDFGDGSTGNGSTMSHNYGAAGSYTVCLDVVGGCASGSVCEVVLVEEGSASTCYANATVITPNTSHRYDEIDLETGLTRFSFSVDNSSYTHKNFTKTRSGDFIVLLSNPWTIDNQFVLAKFDEDENVIWANQYYSSSYNQGVFLAPANSDSTFLRRLSGTGIENAGLIKLNENGDLLYSKDWNYGGDDEVMTCIPDGDGQTCLVRNYPTSFFLSHFDNEGDLVWNRKVTININDPLKPYYLKKAPDGGYIILCAAWGDTNWIILTKIESDLSIGLTKKYTYNFTNYGYNFKPSLFFHNYDWFYLRTTVQPQGVSQPCIAKISPTGDLIWSKLLTGGHGAVSWFKPVGDDIFFRGGALNSSIQIRTDTDFSTVCSQDYPIIIDDLTSTISNFTPSLSNKTLTVTPTTINLVKTTNFTNTSFCNTCPSTNCTTTSAFTYPPTQSCGPSQITFTNTSTDASSYEWQVDGDSIANGQDFSYDFPAQGDYVVTLIASDGGNCSAAYSETISILPSALDLELGADQTVCTDTLELETGLVDMVFYLWDKDGVLIGQGPSLVATEEGQYSVSVLDRCGVAAYDTISLSFGSDCVFPGDCDYNGVVDNIDLLAVGVAFGQSGPLRPNATTDFIGQPCPDWSQTQLNGNNYKHIDTDGNGIIDNDDPLAIISNYGGLHDGRVPLNFQTPPLDNILTMEVADVAPSLVQQNSSSVTTIINLDHPLDFDIAVYGIAFSMDYFGDRATADFSNSVLGTEGVDIQVLAHDFTGERIDVSIVGINGQLRAGNGEMCKVVTEVNIISNDPACLQANIYNVRAIAADGSEIPMAGFQGFLTYPNGEGDVSTTNNSPLDAAIANDFPVFTVQGCYECGDFSAAKATAFGVPPHTYLWDNGSTTETANALPLGWHQVSVTDAMGAKAVGQVDIVAKSDFDLGIAIAPSSPGGSNGNVVIAPDNSTEAYPFEINWSNGQIGGSSAAGLAPGDYSVSVSNGAACRKVLNFTVEDAGISLAAKAFLDGPMDHNTGLMTADLAAKGDLPILSPYGDIVLLNFGEYSNIVDWVQITLHDANEPSRIAARATGVLLRDGSITAPSVIDPLRLNAPQGNYYVALHHRNHLSVMTAQPFSLAANGSTIDFSSANLYGSTTAAKVVNSVNYLWSGDSNADQTVDASDRSAAWNARNQSGYLPADFNLDGNVDAADRSIAWNHRNVSGELP